jgi:hypothetical protein
MHDGAKAFFWWWCAVDKRSKMPMAGFQGLASMAAVEAHLWALGTFIYSAVAVASHCGERWERAFDRWRAVMWAELAGSVAAVLSLMPYYLSERGLPAAGIAADGSLSVSRAGARRAGGSGVAVIVLWMVVRRIAGRRGRGGGGGDTAGGEDGAAAGDPGPSPQTRVESWLANKGLQACGEVLGQLGYDQQIDMLMVTHTPPARRSASRRSPRTCQRSARGCHSPMCVQESDVDEQADMLRAVHASTSIPKPTARKFERELAALRTSVK